MKHKALPKRTLLLWQFRVVMLTSILVVLSLYFGFVLPVFNWVALALGLLCLVVISVYLPVLFSTYEIFIKSNAVIINYGVFIKQRHIMPYPGLIYAQTFTTPLARLFGVTAVSLKAVRSRVYVPEMPFKKAEEIMKWLADEVQNG